MYMFIAILFMFMFMYTVIYNNLVANMRNIHDGMRVVYIYIYIYIKKTWNTKIKNNTIALNNLKGKLRKIYIS